MAAFVRRGIFLKLVGERTSPGLMPAASKAAR
jgi:hypothetical protein